MKCTSPMKFSEDVIQYILIQCTVIGKCSRLNNFRGYPCLTKIKHMKNFQHYLQIINMKIFNIRPYIYDLDYIATCIKYEKTQV